MPAVTLAAFVLVFDTVFHLYGCFVICVAVVALVAIVPLLDCTYAL